MIPYMSRHLMDGSAVVLIEIHLCKSIFEE